MPVYFVSTVKNITFKIKVPSRWKYISSVTIFSRKFGIIEIFLFFKKLPYFVCHYLQCLDHCPRIQFFFQNSPANYHLKIYYKNNDYPWTSFSIQFYFTLFNYNEYFNPNFVTWLSATYATPVIRPLCRFCNWLTKYLRASGWAMTGFSWATKIIASTTAFLYVRTNLISTSLTIIWSCGKEDLVKWGSKVKGCSYGSFT